MTTKLFSFFSGAGFLDLGFESEGFEVAFVNEYLPAFLDAYKHSRKVLGIAPPEYGYHAGSITEFSTDPSLDGTLRGLIQSTRENGSIVGFIGGPPCPDFSVGGKNRGREGDNGKLSQTYIHLICQQQLEGNRN
jgi:DNA (cytosine-5)-methyltransferase 1